MRYSNVKTKPTIVIALALLGFAGVSYGLDAKVRTEVSGASSQTWQTGLHRTDLVKRDLNVSNPEVIQVRVDFDAGVAAPKHSHPGVEVAYVISGTFEYQLEGQPPVTLHPGDSLYIPAGTPHIATNVGLTTGAELATYIVDKSSPLVKLEK
ncbi:cupin domain-containing protein [Pseudomonas petrae]|uniref:Cupin domain-containing protein n=1 Tax=Pseudomonas petrae TaxID=2912190 RepID=A0ABS9I917_9PSED|nr:cupin domain-containing protein [Pseudomonas petrae]MCF7530968.1 cupin domain-containing protein [Pseudomonas petrae]MCF7536642.1 cupin domain-containing protein [Pseudomonas petrae]MCF7544253.1 cupin domain-containing protein [Pseudomonas petrae]MCF7554322.1 cupin domain-containing protein [Pseudomonas petrae]